MTFVSMFQANSQTLTANGHLIPAVVSSRGLALVGDVLSYLYEKVERIEDLEMTGERSLIREVYSCVTMILVTENVQDQYF